MEPLSYTVAFVVLAFLVFLIVTIWRENDRLVRELIALKEGPEPRPYESELTIQRTALETETVMREDHTAARVEQSQWRFTFRAQNPTCVTLPRVHDNGDLTMESRHLRAGETLTAYVTVSVINPDA